MIYLHRLTFQIAPFHIRTLCYILSLKSLAFTFVITAVPDTSSFAIFAVLILFISEFNVRITIRDETRLAFACTRPSVSSSNGFHCVTILAFPRVVRAVGKLYEIVCSSSYSDRYINSHDTMPSDNYHNKCESRKHFGIEREGTG